MTPLAQAASVYHVGNSLVIENDQHRVIKALAIQAGHAHAYSMSVILGAPLAFIWEHPDASGGFGGATYPVGLSASHAWDDLILEPYDRGFRFFPYDQPSADGYAENDVLISNRFYQLALAGNPAARLFVYQVFPTLDTFAAPPEERTLAHAETIADQVGRLHPESASPRVIPVGSVIAALGELADRGQLPHVGGHQGLYADGAHMNEIGTYAVALTHLACIYQEDPHVYAVKPVFPAGEDRPLGTPIWSDADNYPLLAPNGGAVWSDTAKVIQDTAWNVVSNYPRSGVAKDLSIETARLPPAFVGQAYAAELAARGGTPPVSWTFAGDAPEGLTLEGNVIVGTPKRAGTTSIYLELRDSSAPPEVASRTLALDVGTLDVPLRFDTTALPRGKRGTRYSSTLLTSGGAGAVAFRLSAGALPFGVTLSPAGALTGSPGEAGTFAFSITATDQAPRPRETSASLQLDVDPLGPETQVAERVTSPISLDGTLSETGFRLSGVATATDSDAAPRVRFATAWDETNLYVGATVEDETTKPSPSQATLEIYVDGDNSKDVIAGANDRRIVVGRTGTLWVPDGRDAGIAARTRENDSASATSGYSAEVEIPWSNLGVSARENVVVGFDLAYHDGIASDRYWHGDASDVTVPRRWGNLLLGPSQEDPGQTLVAAFSSPHSDDPPPAGCNVAARFRGEPDGPVERSLSAAACLAILLAGRRRRRHKQ